MGPTVVVFVSQVFFVCLFVFVFLFFLHLAFGIPTLVYIIFCNNNEIILQELRFLSLRITPI